MCARSPKKGHAAIDTIKTSHPTAHISLLRMDLTSLPTVVAAATHILTHEPALHGLVNNAGIMATPFALTPDGHEAQWQTNYLAHWVLTTHLLPLLRRTARSHPPGAVRIVNLTSSGHLAAPKHGINFADPALPSANPWARYGQSKLANILHTTTLHAAYGPGSPSARNGDGEIWVTAVHPGLVETNLADAVGAGMLSVFSVVRKLGLIWPAERGAWSSLFCAAGEGMGEEECGGYVEVFGRCGEPSWRSGAAGDRELAGRLEEWTEDVMRREGWVR